MGVILRPCVKCGRSTSRSPCPVCAPEIEAERQARQPYRAAYNSPAYRTARAAALRRSGGQCEYTDESGARCRGLAQETHHVIPLSTATSWDEALALCTRANLLAVCWRHNPRGPAPAA